MQQYTYLAINILTILFPLLFSFMGNKPFYRSWLHFFKAFLLIGLPFIIWDVIFTYHKVWQFNPRYVIGIELVNLPLEEVLFFITIPYACLYLYDLVKKQFSEMVIPGNMITIGIAVASAAMLFAGFGNTYTTVVSMLALLSCLALLTRYKKNGSSGHFWAYLALSFLGFLLVNSLLTSIPVVEYNSSEILGVRLGTIPIEDILYLFVMQAGFGVAFDKYSSSTS